MKTNALIRVSPNPSVRTKSKTTTIKKNHFIEINNDVDHLWQMYQAQLQRNGELMSVIDRQQQFIQQVISKGVVNSLTPEITQVSPQQLLPAIPLPEFKDMSVENLQAISTRFKELYFREVKRLDAVHSIIRLLYILHQMGGGAFPEQLFEKANIGKSTGFRYAPFLQRKHLIKKVGGKYNTRYKITHWGKQLLDCTLQKDYDRSAQSYPTPEEGNKAWEAYRDLNE